MNAFVFLSKNITRNIFLTKSHILMNAEKSSDNIDEFNTREIWYLCLINKYLTEIFSMNFVLKMCF